MSISTKIFGIDTAQDIRDVVEIDNLINSERFDLVIEFGSWRGGLSLYLKCLSYVYDFEFYTFDTDNININKLGKIVKINESFRMLNLFDSATIEMIANIINKYNKVLLICDNGNKKLEFNTYVKYLPSGSYVLVHDWNKEVKLEDLNLERAKYIETSSFIYFGVFKIL